MITESIGKKREDHLATYLREQNLTDYYPEVAFPMPLEAGNRIMEDLGQDFG